LLISPMFQGIALCSTDSYQPFHPSRITLGI